MDPKRKETLDGLILQWNKLEGYVEHLDTSHWSVFTVVIAIMGLLSFLDVDITNPTFTFLKTVLCWIAPSALMLVVYYEAYRLREVSLIKSYLRIVEEKINKLIGSKKEEDEYVFEWYCCYDPVFFPKNNYANTLFPVPVVITLIIIKAIIWKVQITDAFNTHTFLDVVYIGYYFLSIVFDVIALLSVRNNRKIEYYVYRTGSSNVKKEKVSRIGKIAKNHQEKLEIKYKKSLEKWINNQCGKSE